MGGRNGGRPAMRPQLDGGLRLDLYRLQRGGWLVPGRSTTGTLRWTRTRDGSDLAAIGFGIAASDEMATARLTYETTRRATGERVDSDYTISLTSTPQPFGGRRWWFACPVTGAKAAVLYMPAGHTRFASQRALRGSYRTQRISPRDRAMELAQDIDLALGGSGNLFDWHEHRPRGMHRTTLDRKWGRASRAREKSIAALGDWLDRTRPAWRGSAAG